MAGDWIKMRMDLPEDPAVYRLARLTGLDRLSVVGRLYAFWAWADKHAVDGRVDGGASADVDDVARHEGFADAMASVNWLEIGADYLAIPKHDRHNGESAKERTLKNQRQARWRGKQDGEEATQTSTQTSTSPSTAPPTREEKRREEKIGAKAPKQGYAPPDWVPAEHWTAFVQMRRAMRNVPFTDAAAKGVVGELEKLCNAGGDPGELLQSAVTNGWRTVYPPKTNGHTGNRQEALEQRNRATGEAWATRSIA